MKGNQKSKIHALCKKRIGVLFGGWSAERAISLKSGEAVCASLKRSQVPCVPIDVSRKLPAVLQQRKIDLVFLAMHGPFGEDGCLQGLLDMMGIPYTGSRVLASALAMHKPSAKHIFQSVGLSTPQWFCVDQSSAKDNLPQKPGFGFPWIVKPASQGSALGIHIVRSSSQWTSALRKTLKFDQEALVEQFAQGTEISVGVLGNHALPVIEIIPKHGFYDFYSKYAEGGSRHLIPARLPRPVLKKASAMALAAFQSLGCRHFARVDMIVPRSGKPLVLEVNTLPGLTKTSLLPDAARVAGIGFDELILDILSMAMKSKF